MKTETMIGMVLPQAKAYLGLPEAGGGKEGSSPGGFERSLASLTYRCLISSVQS